MATTEIHPDDTLRSAAVRDFGPERTQGKVAERTGLCLRSVSLLWNGKTAGIRTFEKYATGTGHSLPDTVAMWKRSGNRKRAAGLRRHQAWSKKK